MRLLSVFIDEIERWRTRADALLVPLADNRLVIQLSEYKAIFIVDCDQYQQEYQQTHARYWLAKIK